MEKKYKEIEFVFGNLDKAVEELQKYKEVEQLVFIQFNGVKLYSDIDDFDSAYKKVTGLTKEEFDREQELRHQRYQEEKRKHEEAIPNLTIKWIKKGKKVLDEVYHEKWIKCVPIRLNDLYQGMELGMCLDIVAELNNDCDFEKAKEIIEDQGHSGMSFGLMCSMLESFCDRGEDFVKFLRNK